MQGRMKAIVKAKAAPGVEMQVVNIPRIGENDVLVKIQAFSLCGTDKHIYEWDPWAASRIRPPRIIGHEMAGIVQEVGKEVTKVKPGDFVSSESHIWCGHCVQCRNNQQHICANLLILGVDTDGIFGEYAVLPQNNVWKNDSRIPHEVASMQDAMGNAVYTVLAGEVVGNTVAVIGCGAIGLGAIPVAKAAGAKAVFVTDVSEYRLALAKRLGADVMLNPTTTDVVKEIITATDGVGVDVVLEMSGHPTAIGQGFQMLRKGGRVSLLGLAPKPFEFDLNNWIVFKGATVIGINGREIWRTWEKMQALQVSGLVDFSPIVTHTLPMDDYEKGFALMKSGQCGKIVLIP
jgi:threonine 3-dehydrogenase